MGVFFGDMSVGDGDFLWGNVGVRGGVEGTWEKGEDGPSLSFPFLSSLYPLPHSPHTLKITKRALPTQKNR